MCKGREVFFHLEISFLEHDENIESTCITHENCFMSQKKNCDKTENKSKSFAVNDK